MNIRSPAIISSLSILVGFGMVMLVHEAYLSSYLSPAADETSNLVPIAESSAERPANGIAEINNTLSSEEPDADDELPDSDTDTALRQPDAAVIKDVTTWSAVWRPFFSQATAKGFSDYIGAATGLSLRVSRSHVQGQYLVEVRHVSEAERLVADQLIVETTGYRPTDALQ